MILKDCNEQDLFAGLCSLAKAKGAYYHRLTRIEEYR